MKMITFNTWGGRVGAEPIKSFFKKHQDTDVFCLQEIWQTLDRGNIEVLDERIVINLLEEIASVLPDHQIFFRPQYRNIYGLASFIKKTIKVEDEGELFVFKHQGHENPISVGNHARNIQYLNLQMPKGTITIINFHGLWNGQGKTDTPDRLEQSQKIANFIKQLKNPFILTGDFNLNPDTESFKILEQLCHRNLIKDYRVVSTRSKFYEKPGKFADYTLTSPEIKVIDFKVLPDEVSDHLALQVTFE